MQFKDLVGHNSVGQKLIESVNAGRVAHALFLVGPKGSGALQLALTYAQFLNCENKLTDESGQVIDACGTCASCVKAAKLVHPDIHFSYPVIPIKSGKPPLSVDYISDWRKACLEMPFMHVLDWMAYINAENKQGNITRDECHQIIKRLSLRSYEGAYKVQIIWMAEHLKDAGNVLLKILEEPPANTVFILIAENKDAVLNTVRSRTQMIPIAPFSINETAELLNKHTGMDTQDALSIAKVVDGDFHLALQLASGNKSDYDTLFKNWLGICAELGQGRLRVRARLLQWVDEVAKVGRENQKAFCRFSLNRIKSVMEQVHMGKPVNEEELATYKTLGGLTPETLIKVSSALSEMHYHVERNANPRILFYNNSLKVGQLFSKKPILASS